MKHILRFIRFIRTVLVILCMIIIASAIFPGVFSWSTEKGKEQIQEFVDNVRDSAGHLLADIQEKAGFFTSRVRGTDTGEAQVEESTSDTSGTPGRSDYIAPENTGRELAPEQTHDVEVNYGDTDTDTSFDPLYYPYYGILTAEEQILYKQLYANMMNRNAEFDLKVKTDRESLARVFEAICNDHPEIFWLEISYQYGYFKSSGAVATVILNFNETAEYYLQASEEFHSAAEKIIQGASVFENEIDKEKYVHDALNAQTAYEDDSPLNQSAYSALVNGSSVCAGYSKAFQYIMQQLGIPCYYCTGYAQGEHAWNVVYIGGNYYYVDVSWDDGSANPYEFFNVPEEEFLKTHSISGLSGNVFGSLQDR